MFSHPSGSSPVARGAAYLGHLHEGAVTIVTGVNLICTSGSETPVTIDSTANLIFGVEQNCLVDFFGQATATVACAYTSAFGDRPVPLYSEGEPESAFIENDRVIAFRPIAPELRRALQSADLRLTPDDLQFVARARGRRLRFEEDPETQSE
jgi:hypothetical protein